MPEGGAEAEPGWLDEAQARTWITFMQDGWPRSCGAGFQAVLEGIYQTLVAGGTLAAPPETGLGTRQPLRAVASAPFTCHSVPSFR
jgi:hypothetical protein